MSYEPGASKLVCDTEVRDFVAEAIDATGLSAKELARTVDSTPPAAENWKARRNTMSLTHFVRLARAHPAFKAAARRLLALESELSPELEAELVRLQQALSAALERQR